MGKHMPDENDIHGVNFYVQKMFTHQVQFSSTIFLLSLYFAELLRRYFFQRVVEWKIQMTVEDTGLTHSVYFCQVFENC